MDDLRESQTSMLKLKQDTTLITKINDLATHIRNFTKSTMKEAKTLTATLKQLEDLNVIKASDQCASLINICSEASGKVNQNSYEFYAECKKFYSELKDLQITDANTRQISHSREVSASHFQLKKFNAKLGSTASMHRDANKSLEASEFFSVSKDFKKSRHPELSQSISRKSFHKKTNSQIYKQKKHVLSTSVELTANNKDSKNRACSTSPTNSNLRSKNLFKENNNVLSDLIVFFKEYLKTVCQVGGRNVSELEEARNSLVHAVNSKFISLEAGDLVSIENILKERMEKLTLEVKEHELTIDRLRASSGNKSTDENSRKVAQLEMIIDQLTDYNKQLKEKSNSTERNLNSSASLADKYRQDYQEKEKEYGVKIDNLTDELRKKESLNDSLKSEVRQLNEKVNEMTKEYDELLAEQKDKVVTERAVKLDEEKGYLHEVVEKLKKDLNVLNEENRKLIKENVDCKQQMKRIREDNNELKGIIKENIEDKQKVQAELREALKKVDKSDSENIKLYEEKADCVRKIYKQTKELQDLERKLAKLTGYSVLAISQSAFEIQGKVTGEFYKLKLENEKLKLNYNEAQKMLDEQVFKVNEEECKKAKIENRLFSVESFASSIKGSNLKTEKIFDLVAYLFDKLKDFFSFDIEKIDRDDFFLQIEFLFKVTDLIYDYINDLKNELDGLKLDTLPNTEVFQQAVLIFRNEKYILLNTDTSSLKPSNIQLKLSSDDLNSLKKAIDFETFNLDKMSNEQHFQDLKEVNVGTDSVNDIYQLLSKYEETEFYKEFVKVLKSSLNFNKNTFVNRCFDKLQQYEQKNKVLAEKLNEMEECFDEEDFEQMKKELTESYVLLYEDYQKRFGDIEDDREIDLVSFTKEFLWKISALPQPKDGILLAKVEFRGTKYVLGNKVTGEVKVASDLEEHYFEKDENWSIVEKLSEDLKIKSKHLKETEDELFALLKQSGKEGESIPINKYSVLLAKYEDLLSKMSLVTQDGYERRTTVVK